MERQRQIEADRNKKALDRALAKPFVKVGNKNSTFSVVWLVFKIIISILWGKCLMHFFYQQKILWQELKSYGYWIVYVLVVPTSTIREKNCSKSGKFYSRIWLYVPFKTNLISDLLGTRLVGEITLISNKESEICHM